MEINQKFRDILKQSLVDGLKEARPAIEEDIKILVKAIIDSKGTSACK